MSESEQISPFPTNGHNRPDGQLVNMEKIATTEDRAYEAHMLRVAGHSWSVIAKQLGYANAKTVEVTVRTYLQRAAAEMSGERRQEALELAIERTEALVAAYWPTALGGEVKHAELVLKAIASQSRLLGLEEMHSRATQTTKTILITGDSSDYAGALQRLVEGD